MADDTQNTPEVTDSNTEVNSSNTQPNPMQEHIKKLNDENAARRRENKELTERLKAFEDERKAALQEAGNHEELSRQLQSENDELRKRAELVDSYEESIKAANEQLIKRIPEDKRSLVPDAYSEFQKNEWLLSNMDSLTAVPKPVNVNGGAETGNSRKSQKPLTELQIQAMKHAGITEEAYRKNLPA